MQAEVKARPGNRECLKGCGSYLTRNEVPTRMVYRLWFAGKDRWSNWVFEIAEIAAGPHQKNVVLRVSTGLIPIYLFVTQRLYERHTIRVAGCY